MLCVQHFLEFNPVTVVTAKWVHADRTVSRDFDHCRADVVDLAGAWVQSGHWRAGAAARSCLNNIRNLALALQNSAASPCRSACHYLDEGGYNWPVSLLAYLDRGDITGSVNPAASYNTTSIAVLTCPNDVNNFQNPNGLSYGVNAGYGIFGGAG